MLPEVDHVGPEGLRLQRPSEDHTARFYEDDADLVRAVAEHMALGLRSGEHGLLVVVGAHRAPLLAGLTAQGIDLATADLTVLDADATLEALLVDGLPDPARFDAVVGAAVRRLFEGGGASRVRAFGEMVDVLWRDGRRDAALRLEELWNDLRTRYPFALLCGYSMAGFHKTDGLREVCLAHGHVDGPAPTGADASPHRALLAEIAQRVQVEDALRQALRQLRQREAELDDLVENAAVAMHRVDAAGVVLWANRAELDLLGYSRGEYVGRPIADVHVDPAVARDLLDRLRRGEAIVDHEAQLRRRDGAIVHVSISSNGVRAEDGTFRSSRCVTLDRTDRHRAEAELKRRERQLRLIVDAIPALVSYVDASGTYRLVNRGYEEWFGTTASDMVGRTLTDVLGEAAMDTLRPHVQRVLAGEPVTFESEVTYRGGSRWIEATYSPDHTPEGQVAGYAALVQDITQRRARLERASRLVELTAALSRATTRDEVIEVMVVRGATLIGAATGGLWLEEGGSAGLRLARSVGYSDRGRAAFATLPLDGRMRIPVMDACRGGHPVWVPRWDEFVVGYPELAAGLGPRTEYAIAALPLSVEARIVGALAFTFDADQAFDASARSFLQAVAAHCAQALERTRLFERERASAARNATLAAASRAFHGSSLDLRGVLDAVTTEIAREIADGALIVVPAAEGRTAHRSFRHRDPDAEADFRAVLEGAGDASLLFRRASPSEALVRTGEQLRGWVAEAPAAHRAWLERHPPSCVLSLPLQAGDQVVAVFTALRGRSREPFSEEECALLQDLADRGALAIRAALALESAEHARRAREDLLAIVSHDLRNPVQTIVASATVLQSAVPAGHSATERLQQVAGVLRRSATQMTQLLADLLDYSAIQGDHLRVQPSPTPVRSLFDAVREFELVATERDQLLVFRAPPDDVRVSCEARRIQQVLTNLVGNALKYAGRARIEVSAVPQAKAVRFVVADDGPGLSKEELRHLFDKYWQGAGSEARPRQGVGLGLFISRGIVNAHGSDLEVDSAPGRGARFSFELPYAEP